MNASLGGPNNTTTPATARRTVSAAITASPNTLFASLRPERWLADEVRDDVETAPSYPCRLHRSNLMCVAATDANDRLAHLSLRLRLHLGRPRGPGEYILSTWKRNGGQDQYAYESGTSQAAPRWCRARRAGPRQKSGATMSSFGPIC